MGVGIDEREGGRRTRGLIVLAGLAFAVLFAVPQASASTVSLNYRIEAAPGEANHIVVTQVGSSLTITDSAGITDGSASCSQINANEVSCGPLYQYLTIEPRDRDDSVDLNLAPIGNFNLQVAGGAGNDTIDAADTVGPSISSFSYSGDDGNDTIIGGSGGERIDSAQALSLVGPPEGLGTHWQANPPDAGDDTLIGNGGDDEIRAGRGADVVEGGEGNDILKGLSVKWDKASGDLSLEALAPDDGASDTMRCGGGTDVAELGVGDQSDLDCEVVAQWVTCPSGADCEGVTSVTAISTGGAASAAAAKKRSKGKRLTVLGKGRKVKVRSGTTSATSITLKPGKVRSALGNRASTAATMQLGLTRVKKGKTVGKTKRRVRFQLNR